MSARPHFKLGTDGRLSPALRSRGVPISALSGDYEGFNSDPTIPGAVRWFRPGLRDAVGDTLRRLPLQRGESRDLTRSNPIAAGAINTNVDRVVGTGLALVVSPDRRVLGWSDQQAQDWKRQVQAEFSVWADSAECDWAGEQNFYEKQGLTLRSALESGDCLSLLPDGEPSNSQPYKLRIQTIEADRCGNPMGVVDGQEVAGRIVAGGVRRAPGKGVAEAYHILDQHPGALWPLTASLTGTGGQWIDRIGPSGRRGILHHFRQLRPEAPRGVPYLAPIVGHLQQLGRYTEYEIKAAVVTAMLTVFVESAAGGNAAPVFGLTDAEVAANPEIVLGGGAVIGLAPGETAKVVNPLRPNTAFEAFVHAILQQVGVGLNLPGELLTKKFDASYSASKAALLDAWMWFRSQRVWLARSFCQPVYETWLSEAVASRRIPAPGFFRDPLVRWAYTRAGWHGDSQGSINPKDEVAAYLAAVDGRIMTRERAEWELAGTDWYETFDSKKVEQQMLSDANLLPVPKAGAAAPQDAGTNDGAATDGAGPAAMLEVREQPAPHVHVHMGAQTFKVEPAQVHIEQGDTTIHLPESQITVEAVIEQPNITLQSASVRVDVPAPQVVVQPAPFVATRQLISREGDEITEIVTERVGPTQH